MEGLNHVLWPAPSARLGRALRGSERAVRVGRAPRRPERAPRTPHTGAPADPGPHRAAGARAGALDIGKRAVNPAAKPDAHAPLVQPPAGRRACAAGGRERAELRVGRAPADPQPSAGTGGERVRRRARRRVRLCAGGRRAGGDGSAGAEARAEMGLSGRGGAGPGAPVRAGTPPSTCTEGKWVRQRARRRVRRHGGGVLNNGGPTRNAPRQGRGSRVRAGPGQVGHAGPRGPRRFPSAARRSG